MFCPECKAEFRSGFTECSDCGVALVEVAPRLEDRFKAIPESAPAEFDELLLRAKDPGFYLSLLATLANFRIPCYGKAANPTHSSSSWPGAIPEFEIWVPSEQCRRAAWVRDSFQEDHVAGEDLDLEDEQITLGPAMEPPDSSKLCALCSAEYAREAALCENCGTSLFWSNQPVPRGELARPLFSEAQPQILGALRAALLQQNIPFNNALLYRDGLLRGNSSVSSTEIVVRNSDLERANQVLAHLLEGYEFEPTSGIRSFVDPLALYWPRRADRNGWLPEDLVALTWTGHNFFRLRDAASALREHEIAYRAEAADPKAARLLVHPDDLARARQIVGEAVEGSVPE
jgi:hypothetical protein